MFSLMRSRPSPTASVSGFSTRNLLDCTKNSRDDPLLSSHDENSKAAVIGNSAPVDLYPALASPNNVIRKRRELY